MGYIKGKIGLITGASSGIGEKTTRALCDAGIRVICSARRAMRLEATAAELGEGAIVLELEFTSGRSVETLPDRLPKEWSAIIKTNVIGLMRVTRAVLESMVRRDSGHIVNISSIAGVQTSPLCAAYAASKHAVHGFSETLRLDYANTGIKVSEVLPGMVKTEFETTRFVAEDRGAKYYEGFGICLEPEDIACSVFFPRTNPPMW